MKNNIKKTLLLFFLCALFFCCSNERNPYSPSEKTGFIQEQLLPWLGIKDDSVLLMVYLDAANSLETAGILDFQEIAAGRFNSPSKEVRVLVLMDKISVQYEGDWTGTRLYLADKSGIKRLSGRINGVDLKSTGDNDELNMGQAATLKDFILYGLGNFPGGHNILVLWNHGGGWKERNAGQAAFPPRAVCFDDESSDYLGTDELGQALRESLAGRKLDAVYFDACVMQMAEVAYEIKDHAYCVIGAVGLVPGTGADYTGVISRFSRLETYSPLALSREMFASYCDTYRQERSMDITLSILDTDRLQALSSGLNGFVSGLTNTPYSTVSNIRSQTKGFYETDSGKTNYHADLYGFAALARSAGIPGSQAVLDALNGLVTDNYSPAGSGGIAVYFPSRPESCENTYWNNTYLIDFIDSCSWPRFIAKWHSRW